MAHIELAVWGVLAGVLAVSLVTDLLWRRILDAVTYPALLLCLGLRTWGGGVGDAESGLVSGLIAAALGFVLFAVVAWRGRMGWGDAKLMAVVGAALGYPAVLAALVFVSLVGALQAVVTLLWHGQVWDTIATVGRRWAVKTRLLPKETNAAQTRHIPYGVAIAVGTAWAMWWEHSSRQGLG